MDYGALALELLDNPENQGFGFLPKHQRLAYLATMVEKGFAALDDRGQTILTPKGRTLAKSQRPRNYRGPRQELGEGRQKRGRKRCQRCKKRRGTGGGRNWGLLDGQHVCHICLKKASDNDTETV